jgi:hypothetical protein
VIPKEFRDTLDILSLFWEDFYAIQFEHCPIDFQDYTQTLSQRLQYTKIIFVLFSSKI